MDAYTGVINVNQGLLRIKNSIALGAATTSGNTVVPASGGGIQLDGSAGALAVAENFSLSGSGVNSGGALQNMAGSNTLSGTVTLTGSTTIGADEGSSLTISGSLLGAQALTLSGAGNISGPVLGAASV